MPRLSYALFVEESGQDLIEYALLTALIGLAGAAVLSLLQVALGAAYGGWDAGIQGLWEPSNPL